MKVADFMSTSLVTISPDSTLSRVWELISQKHIHGLPVIDKNKKMIGFVSKEDMLSKLFPDSEDPEEMYDDSDDTIEEKLEKLKKMTVEKVMNKKVIFTRTDTPILRALSRMIVRKIHQLPVLDDDSRLVGLISKGDVFNGMFKRKK